MDEAEFEEIKQRDAAGAPVELRPRPTNEADFPEYIEYLVHISDPRTDEQRLGDTEAKDKYGSDLILDTLFVGGPGFPAGFSEEMYELATQHSADNSFTAISATISNGSDTSAGEVFERMRATNRYWKDRADKYLQVFTVEDIHAAKASRRLGMHHNFQSGNPLDGDLSNLEKYYHLGLRQMNFTYNVDNELASGCVSNSGGTDTGLTTFGEAAVREMNRLGIVVDASHSSNQTAIDAATLSTRPVVLSHSNVATFQPIDRNASDPAIKTVAATGGVICINFIGGFLNPQGDATPFSIAKHAHYIRNLVGPEHVGAGSDYVFNYAETLDWVLRNPTQFPPEMGYASPSHMGKPGEVWGVVKELEATFGWKDHEIRGLLGANILRVYRDVWR